MWGQTGSRTEEAQMYSQMVQGMAAERTKDLRREAAVAAQVRLARSGGRPGESASWHLRPAPGSPGGPPIRKRRQVLGPISGPV